jgi:hypothetical protein
VRINAAVSLATVMPARNGSKNMNFLEILMRNMVSGVTLSNTDGSALPISKSSHPAFLTGLRIGTGTGSAESDGCLLFTTITQTRSSPAVRGAARRARSWTVKRPVNRFDWRGAIRKVSKYSGRASLGVHLRLEFSESRSGYALGVCKFHC